MRLVLITAALYTDFAAASSDAGFHKALESLSHPPDDTSFGGYHIYDDFNSLFVETPLSPHGGAPDHYSRQAYY